MKQYAVGVDVGATHTKIAIVNLRGCIVARDAFYTKSYGEKELIKAIGVSVDSLIAKIKLKKKDILGLGIGVPGLVDIEKGLVFYFVNIPGWKNVYMKKDIEKETGFASFVDNDVKVMALGELTFGAGKNYKNIICLTLGTGVGGAVISERKLVRGSSLVAGEIGHVPINEKGPSCNCGSFGCLESYVGMGYFLNDVRNDLKKGAKSIVRQIAGGRLADITPEMLKEAALRGDSFAKKKWAEMGEHLGSALAGVVNLLNPELIIIGGGIAEAEKFIFGSIRKIINKKAMKIQRKAVRIVKAKLGNDAGVIGAAELAIRGLR